MPKPPVTNGAIPTTWPAWSAEIRTLRRSLRAQRQYEKQHGRSKNEGMRPYWIKRLCDLIDNAADPAWVTPQLRHWREFNTVCRH